MLIDARKSGLVDILRTAFRIASLLFPFFLNHAKDVGRYLVLHVGSQHMGFVYRVPVFLHVSNPLRCTSGDYRVDSVQFLDVFVWDFDEHSSWIFRRYFSAISFACSGGFPSISDFAS